MKKLSEKQRIRGIRRLKKRLPKEIRRKAKRRELLQASLKIKTSWRRIQKAQKKLRRLAR